MDNSQPKFPDYFPEGCPPSDAVTEELHVYRYLFGEEVTESDFISYYLNDKEKYRNEFNAYGLSVLTNKEKMIKALKLPGIKKKYKCIAGGITYKYTGVVKNTYEPCHLTWWLFEGIKPHEFFELCI